MVCFGPHKSVQVDLVDLGIPKNAGVSEANQLWSKGLWGVASNLTCTTECAGHEAVSTSCSGVTLVRTAFTYLRTSSHCEALVRRGVQQSSSWDAACLARAD